MPTVPSEPNPDVVIYDLDGVITTRDTFTVFTIEQLCQRPFRLLPAIPIAVRRYFSKDEEFRRIAGVRIARIALRGLDDREFALRVESFGRRVGNSRTWIRNAAVERVQEQKKAGARIIIATATEHRLAQALLESAGVPFDLLSGTTFTTTPTGMDVDDHRLNERKAEALRELDVPVQDAEFVTDSFTDLPTAREAGTVVLIGASMKTRKQFQAAGVEFRTVDS